MAFEPYHNIVGSTAQEVELVGIGDLRSSIKSVHLLNVHSSNAATISLYIYKPGSKPQELYFLLKDYSLAAKAFLVLDDAFVLNFNNKIYSLFIEVGSSDTVDVILGI